MDNYILSVGTANPGNKVSQEKISKFMINAHGLDRQQSRKLKFIYKHSGIQSRHSALEDFDHEDHRHFSFCTHAPTLALAPRTNARMEVYRKVAPAVASTASEDCRRKAKTRVTSKTRLVVVSCTGMYAPGVEIDL